MTPGIIFGLLCVFLLSTPPAARGQPEWCKLPFDDDPPGIMCEYWTLGGSTLCGLFFDQPECDGKPCLVFPENITANDTACVDFDLDGDADFLQLDSAAALVTGYNSSLDIRAVLDDTPYTTGSEGTGHVNVTFFIPYLLGENFTIVYSSLNVSGFVATGPSRVCVRPVSSGQKYVSEAELYAYVVEGGCRKKKSKSKSKSRRSRSISRRSKSKSRRSRSTSRRSKSTSKRSRSRSKSRSRSRSGSASKRSRSRSRSGSRSPSESASRSRSYSPGCAVQLAAYSDQTILTTEFDGCLWQDVYEAAPVTNNVFFQPRVGISLLLSSNSTLLPNLVFFYSNATAQGAAPSIVYTTICNVAQPAVSAVHIQPASCNFVRVNATLLPPPPGALSLSIIFVNREAVLYFESGRICQTAQPTCVCSNCSIH